MKDVKISNGRRAYSPVITAIILSAVVLAVGGAVWSFSQGAMTVTADDYIDGVNDLIDTISERFVIEHVANSETQIRVWVYNYGEVAIVVDVYVDIDGGESNSVKDIEVESKDIYEVIIDFSSIQVDKEVAIKTVSRRGNNAYYRYLTH
ncbi:MAG: hypothetical protein OEZ52_14590 [Candidatus Aminicenantes bacterium]|nr:hypothetical protein [Candidatus Aminicenantes bacterium]